MDISFGDDKIQKLCEQSALAQRKLGAVGARKLRARMADLMAASSVRELTTGRPHPLQGDRAGEFALDLDGGRRLVFKSNNDPIPRKEDGGIDWSNVTKICVTYVGDYHD
jgi:toxin HigB-1